MQTAEVDARASLLAVLACPPTTSGTRTRQRVEMLAHLLGYASVDIVNVFPLAAYRSTEISVLGAESTPWHAARLEILPAVATARGVLMAYGIGAPTGPAGGHFQDQIRWLQSVVAKADLPAWQLGDGPRHPSRWQRWTHREHPGLDFPAALVASITSWSGR